jgi:GNAT superfamily N-acetyltransferase
LIHPCTLSVLAGARSATAIRSPLAVDGLPDQARRMTTVVVREAGVDDADRLAALKEQWAMLPEPASPEDRASFARDLASWMTAQGPSLIARVAEADGRLVGMAWLVAFERVPDIRNRRRVTGDIQSVFVVPEHRRSGIGGELIRSLMDAAAARSIARVTVSANETARGLYLSLGFEQSALLLQADPRHPRWR